MGRTSLFFSCILLLPVKPCGHVNTLHNRSSVSTLSAPLLTTAVPLTNCTGGSLLRTWWRILHGHELLTAESFDPSAGSVYVHQVVRRGWPAAAVQDKSSGARRRQTGPNSFSLCFAERLIISYPCSLRSELHVTPEPQYVHVLTCNTTLVVLIPNWYLQDKIRWSTCTARYDLDTSPLLLPVLWSFSCAIFRGEMALGQVWGYIRNCLSLAQPIKCLVTTNSLLMSLPDHSLLINMQIHVLHIWRARTQVAHMYNNIIRDWTFPHTDRSISTLYMSVFPEVLHLTIWQPFVSEQHAEVVGCELHHFQHIYRESWPLTLSSSPPVNSGMHSTCLQRSNRHDEWQWVPRSSASLSGYDGPNQFDANRNRLCFEVVIRSDASDWVRMRNYGRRLHFCDLHSCTR